MKKIIVAITGASGSIYGIRLLEAARGLAETHLIISEAAEKVIALETSHTIDHITSLASFSYDNRDLAALPASGSFKTDAMVIIPCSIKTLASAAYSTSDTLIARAADVTLKERRRLVLCVRETPLHAGHIQCMAQVTASGGIISPLSPAFYSNPHSIQDLVDFSVGKVFDLLGIDNTLYRRWKEDAPEADSPEGIASFDRASDLSGMIRQ